MQNLLVDLCVESEAHTLMAMRMAYLFNKATMSEANDGKDSQIGDLFRISVTISKYYVTKKLPNFVYECMEVY